MGWNKLSQIMKSSSKILIAIIAVVILAGTAFLIVRHHGHRPHAQSPHAAGAYLVKNQFAFAGYATPEAALESMLWAYLNGDYDMVMSSVGPKDQADLKKTIWRKSKALPISNAESIHAVQRRANSCQEKFERRQGGTQISDCHTRWRRRPCHHQLHDPAVGQNRQRMEAHHERKHAIQNKLGSKRRDSDFCSITAFPCSILCSLGDRIGLTGRANCHKLATI